MTDPLLSSKGSPPAEIPQAPQPVPPSASALLVLAVALLVLAVALVAYTMGVRSATSDRPAPPPVPAAPSTARMPAPSFTLPSLRGEGRISLADFRGQVVVVNFFASWCEPCTLEAADLQRAWRKVEGHHVTFLGVAIQDQYREAQAFLNKYGVTYPAAFDRDGTVSEAYRLTGIPTTVFVDPQGRMAGRHSGIFVGDQGIAALLERIEAAREPLR